ncbi:MAG: hypothetical protein KHZ90_08565 [Veillonella parvula]|uniref:Uncharacterized protein n=1 Tax=Veillonella parvula TaxID=29466 RepID=A0A943A479_VEIPA|nr:hypothetical protein [Veillonella parvula]MBS4893814.1 hypothetical protein [Veillonella parvula]
MVAKYLLTYMYNGDPIGEIIPFKTMKEVKEELLKSLNGEEFEETGWEELSNGIRVKHYYIEYNTYSIVDLTKAKYNK